MFQITRSAPVADVVIIGSGAGGGTVTKVLADLGVSVTLLEAGPMLHPETDFKEHKWPYDYPHRGSGEGGASYFGRGRDFGWFSAHAGGWHLEGEPYTVAEGSKFQWFRSRIVGGRTNHYGRISLRYADYDLKPYSRDGVGTDWPISYEDIAPYYDKAESFIGITGSKEGIRSAPDGVFQPCPPPRVHEVLIKKAADKLGIPCIPNRLAVITKPTNGRPACHYCGECGRGCISASNYSSSQVQVFPAMKTGRVNLITNAMARELITDSEGRVTAVSYIDKVTRTEKQVKCRTVVLAASCCESTRLLLNSRAPRHANGLANSSGAVGRYLTDNTGFSLGASLPALRGMPRHDSDGMGGAHLYIPWWLWDKKTDFPRGYHIELSGGYSMPGIGSYTGVANRVEGYGDSLKKAIYDEYGSRVSFAGRGEMIPNPDTYCEIDNNVVDKYGIPVLKFHFKWTDAELKQVEHMEKTFTDLIETMGGTVTRSSRPTDQKISIGGEIIHEVGSIRMGNDPKTSALNKYCQSHDVKNVFVADAAPFVSNPDKNPTLTICALAWRTAEYLAEEMRKGNV
ncbi:MAG TPA: GMC family oxidoreductase [Bryobacteraceae bacterium]|nr:GMC family oxidoreductase [Bryobacteraceae bacterium]